MHSRQLAHETVARAVLGNEMVDSILESLAAVAGAVYGCYQCAVLVGVLAENMMQRLGSWLTLHIPVHAAENSLLVLYCGHSQMVPVTT